MEFYNTIAKTTHKWILGENSVKSCIEYLKAGKPIIVVDDDDRENEGDLIIAGEDTTPEIVALFLKITSGVICCAIPENTASSLKLSRMYSNSKDPNNTAFTTSIDYNLSGVTTGISARDRSITIKALTNDFDPEHYRQPGHIFPLVAKENGVLERLGHTEATIDIMRLSGKKLCGTLCEIVSRDKITMSKMDELEVISKEMDIPITSIQDIICYKIIHA